jgi:hypothetical protein
VVKGDRGLRSLEEEEVVARRGKATDGRTDGRQADGHEWRRRFSLDTTKENRNGDSVRDFS